MSHSTIDIPVASVGYVMSEAVINIHTRTEHRQQWASTPIRQLVGRRCNFCSLWHAVSKSKGYVEGRAWGWLHMVRNAQQAGIKLESLNYQWFPR